MPIKAVLHVGCGAYMPERLHQTFRSSDWQEIRLDIDPRVDPDIVADIKNMPAVKSESVDAVWSAHNLEHLYVHEVPMALREFCRVLRKPGGFLLITLPDVEAVAREVAKGNLEGVLYHSPSGPISAIDILWGHRASITVGNHFMAHKTGFTANTLREKLLEAGFQKIQITQDSWAIWAIATFAGGLDLSLTKA